MTVDKIYSSSSKSTMEKGYSSSTLRKMSDADRAGFVARSPEGHAARGMNIRGQEEVWIAIQANTFKNWVNVNLTDGEPARMGSSGVKQVRDFETDFTDGTILVALVEKLQKRRLRHNKKPQTQHHELENISIALDAIQEDGIKLVNIGNTDINNGNLKLILGLIWSLIAHYQLGASNFPPKKLMLAWLRAVLPDCKIKNFTNDWNNGIYLSALLDYCKPGLMPNWRKLNPNNGPENCKRALEMANKHFNIPAVLEPEYLASPHLDELSGMTYLSYFMKEEDSPGYYATLDWVKSQIPNQRINNFRNDWNDGLAAASLVKAKGGPVPGYHDMDNYPEHWVSNLDVALKGGKKVGVTPVMESRDMANPNVEYLGVMSWVAQFQWISDKTAPGERLEISAPMGKARVNEECHFKIDVLDKEFSPDAVTAEILGPLGPVPFDFDMARSGGKGVFRADEVGMHEVIVKNEGEPVKGAPHFLRSMPKSKKDYDGIEPCAVGSTVEVLINPHHAARPDLLAVTAYSPTGRPLGCPVSEDNGTFYASFNPDEAGEWKIHVTYDEEDIENSPFRCMVFDPRAIYIPDQNDARRAVPGDPFTFTVDASKTGWGEVAIDVVYENRSIRRTFYVEEVAKRVYKVTFTPQARGKHRVYVYLNGMEVKGSPFALKIGRDIKEARKPATELFRADKRVSRYKTHDESRAERRNYFTEREIPIQAPLAPPRSKKKELNSTRRMSVKDFRDENRTTLFKSDFQTEEGVDLLPVKKKIAFDCPDNGASSGQIQIEIKGPDGRRCPTEIRMNDNGTFTCEFTTSLVGEHSIQVFINDENVNVTPGFFTYDASRMRVGPLRPNPGFIGGPVEFEVDGQGAGHGNMEVIVNHGRVSSHVSKDSKEKYAASFIPHDLGRHRVDIKFNGEKLAQTPVFIEIKDPNKPLMAPGLVTGKVSVSNGTNGYHNGHTNGFSSKTEETFNSSTTLKSSDFNTVDTKRVEESYFDSNVVARNLTNDLYTAQRKASYTQPPTITRESTPSTLNKDKDLPPPTLASSLGNNKHFKMEPAKEFGTFSALSAPALLAGKSNTDERTTTTRTRTTEEFSNTLNKSSTSNNNNNTSSSYYSSTITKPIKETYDEHNFLLSDVAKGAGTFRITENSSSSNITSTANNNNSSSSYKRPPSPVKRESLSSLRGSSPVASKLFNRESSPVSRLSDSKGREPSPAPRTSFSGARGSSPLARESSPLGKASNSAVGSSSSTTTTSKSATFQRGSSSSSLRGSGSKLPVASGTSVKKDLSSSSSFPLATKTTSPSPLSKTSNNTTSSSSYSESTTVTKKGSDNREGYSTTTNKSYSSQTTNKNGEVTKSESSSQNTLTVPKGKDSVPAVGSTSPKLNSYRGTADQCKFLGETVRHFNAGKLATFELKAPAKSTKKEDVQVNIISPEKRPHIPYKVVEESNGRFRIEFTTVEVGSYVIDVTVGGLTVPNSPLIAKAYDAGLIKVTDIQDGIVGELSTFRVDASKSGEGQLEISINDGDVPNAVQVLGGGKCLVTYTPELPLTHEIEVTFNGEQVSGSPFLCRVSDGDDLSLGADSVDFSKVEVGLDHLNLIPVKQTSNFTIRVAGGDDAELAVSVQGPNEDIPVKVTGNVKNGFNAEFVPTEVGPHTILVEYNGVAVGGTPFFSKAYRTDAVAVGDVPKSTAGKTVKFAGSSRH